MPLGPVGNMAACHANSRSAVSGGCVVLGCIEHHLDHALDVAVGRNQATDIHAQPARDRGAHLIRVEDLAFDLAGLEDILGQRGEHGLVAQGKAERSMRPISRPCRWRTAASLVARRSSLPPDGRPVISFMDIGHIHRTYCGEYSRLIAARQSSFTAYYAVNVRYIRRTPKFIETPLPAPFFNPGRPGTARK